MKKYLLLLNFIFVFQMMEAQTQMKHWVVGPKTVNVFSTNPIANTLTTGLSNNAAQTATKVANGWYDKNGNLLFYVCDEKVFDYNNTFLGNIPNNGSEVAIVPFENNNATCNYRFNIFSTYKDPNTSLISLYKTVLDMAIFQLQTPVAVDALPFSIEFGCIAVGTKTVDHLPLIYFMAATGTGNGGRIDRLTINSDGTVSSAVIVYPISTYQNNNAGIELLSRELDLSPDGQWLGWASTEASSISPRYHILKLDMYGDLDASVSTPYQQFSMPPSFSDQNENGARGVEFWQDPIDGTTKLFVGAGLDGIYEFDITIPMNPNLYQFVTLSNGNISGSYGYSQIEWANNGFMYAASLNSANNVGAFNPFNNTYSISGSNSFNLINPNAPFVAGTMASNPPNFYTLPDQIDGQDYSVYNAPAFIPVITVYDYTYNNTFSTWTNSINGWNPTTLPIHIIHHFTIAQNSELIVSQMTFEFNPNASTIILPGGTLRIASSTFTGEADCELLYPWDGIVVEGIPNQTQLSTGFQGRLNISGGAKIEYAVIGADADSDPGGIIQSGNGSFKNCNTAVSFAPYQNMNGGNEYANLSFFTNTNFITNDNYALVFNTPSTGVKMDGVMGIPFNNCTFKINTTNSTILNYQNTGILSNNSSFKVYNGSEFNHLFNGINAMITGGTKTFTVTASLFTKNQTGIKTKSINHFVVSNCNFKFGNDAFSSNADRIGLNNHYGSGFTIKANLFDKPTTTSNNTVGIITNNSGPSNNVIGGNTFSHLKNGNLALNQNRHTGILGNVMGLQYLCNTNYGNGTDMNVDVNTNPCNGCCIRLKQGLPNNAAKNTFSNGATHINNNTGTTISYYWEIPDQPVTTLGPITLFQTGNLTYCSGFPALTWDGHFNAAVYNTNAGNYHSAETDYLNLLYTYNTLLDGGNTNALLSEIENSWSQNAQTLRDELMAASPYLTEDVLRSAAQSDVLPQAMLLTVLLANPDATRNESLLQFLEEDIPHPLPAYMIDLIVDSWTNQTPRTAMENLMAEKSNIMTDASDNILSELFFDETLSPDSMLASDTANYYNLENYWLHRVQCITSEYELVENYFGHQQFTPADTVLQNISSNFNLDEDQIKELSDYNWYYNFRKSLIEDQQMISNLDSTQLINLSTFAYANDNRATQLAKNALCFYYGLCEDENTNGNRHSSQHFHSGDGQMPFENAVTVFPNPANDGTTFIYQLPDEMQTATLSLYNTTGIQIFQTTVIGNIGTYFLQTENLNNGLYYYQLQSNNNLIAQGKLTINK